MGWKARVLYGILWILTVVAYSIPWARAKGQTFVGWSFTVPFSITYVVGIILGLIVLATKRWVFGLTIVAGILMLLGVAGAMFGYVIAGAVGALTGKEVTKEAGYGTRFPDIHHLHGWRSNSS